MNLNDFYFTGTVVSTPFTRAFNEISKTSFDVEQVNTYREVEKKIVLTVNTWHKGESHTQKLVPGDVVMVKGKFSSSPYKERNIMNLDSQHIVMLSQNSESKPVENLLPAFDNSSVPF